MAYRTLLFTSAIIISIASAEIQLITKPQPGQEYVYVQTQASGSRTFSKKEKPLPKLTSFETSHKIPSHILALSAANSEQNVKYTKPHKREANPADAPAPAPAGAIKIDPLKLLERYKTELKTSTTTTTAAPKTTKRKRRIKKAAVPQDEPTSPVPILTTRPATPKRFDDDVPLASSGSDRQTSRIAIKKGPNGKEYEYEYVYYYYDDPEDEKKSGKTTSNSHDGPARNEITKERGRHSEKTNSAPEANEVVPTSRGHNRGKNLNEEDIVGEERLPTNTRFPPRSRNLNTTPLPEDEVEARPTRGRGRGKPAEAISSENDNQSDETQGSRGRTRGNVRRPSVELVDSSTFNTQTNGGELPPGGPSFPSDLPEGPVRFLGATPNERPEATDSSESSSQEEEKIVEKQPAAEGETGITDGETEATTIMSQMRKAVLDLYAISQGTQKLLGEDMDLTDDSELTTEDSEGTTLEITTEEITTEYTTPTTTTTTTTTTTPAPTTTTTTTAAPEPTGRGRFRGRAGTRRTTAAAASSSTETPAENSRPKSKFSRPSFGRRPGARTTAQPATESEVTKEEAKPVSHAKPSSGRTRFGAPRTRTRTTPAPAEESSDSGSPSTSATSRPSLRPRPSFNLRTRGRPTAATQAPAESEAPANEETSAEVSSTTARARTRLSGSGSIRPLRPGPRINLARGRPGVATTTTTTEAPVEETSASEEDSQASEEAEKEPEPAPVQDTNPLNRLRNRQRPNIAVRPKAAASAPVQVRRINPLLARRKPVTPEPSTEAESPATEEPSQEEEDEETEAPAPSSSTTEEPRGLSKLLGRRRLAARQPGTLH